MDGSLKNVEKANLLVKEAIEICAEGGFKLTSKSISAEGKENTPEFAL